MELQSHPDIVDAIVELLEVKVQFLPEEDGETILTRRCAPMDYAPSARPHDKTPRYHFGDFESDGPGNHTLPSMADQVVATGILVAGAAVLGLAGVGCAESRSVVASAQGGVG